jgi:hypothetical protein
MIGCFAGRGSLAVAPVGAAGGFFVLSGESEISFLFEEDNESVFDARRGVNERIDWYVRNRRVRLQAQCFRIEAGALELLLKANVIAVAGSSADIELPDPVEAGKAYLLRPKMSAVSVVDALAAPVGAGNYTLETTYGTITFSATPGTQPYTVSLTSAGHTQFAVNEDSQVLIQALIRGVNKADNTEFMAHFYRLALDITEEMKMVQKPFMPLSVRMHCLPDFSAPTDPNLGQYGRIILL